MNQNIIKGGGFAIKDPLHLRAALAATQPTSSNPTRFQGFRTQQNARKQVPA